MTAPVNQAKADPWGMLAMERFKEAAKKRGPLTLEERRLLHSHEGWVWHGYASHYILGSRCAFHLGTSIRIQGRWFLVSTVGQLLENGRPESISVLGGGPYDFFETMVFPSSGQDEHANPKYDPGRSLKSVRYPDSITAEIGHYQACHDVAALGSCPSTQP